MMARAVPIFLILLPFAAVGAGFQDDLQRLDAVEKEAFRLKSRGEFDQAFSALSTGIEAVFTSLETGKSEKNAVLAARGEILVEFLFTMAERTALFAEAADVLKKTPSTYPCLKAVADRFLLDCRLRLNELDEAARLKRKLGFIERFHLIGPFDNERGGGFHTAYPPEREIDLQARYEGKEREVAWRKNPSEPLAGYINLNSLFRPNDQCLAYALCFLVCSEKKEICLRLGSDEAVKVFLDGREVHALNVRRLRHFDQDVIPLRLEPGKHALLLKICDQTRKWGFAARLTELDGSGVKGIRVVDDPEGFDLSRVENPAPAEKTITLPGRGALGLFERLAEEGGDDRSLFYLGLLHLMHEYKGEAAGEATGCLKRHIEKNPDDIAARYILALSRSKRSEIAAEKNENPWRLGLEEVLALDPENVQCHFRLAAFYTYSLWIPETARFHVETALGLNPRFLEGTVLLARILQDAGLDPLGRLILFKAAAEEENLSNPSLLIELGRIAVADGRHDEARRLVKKALDRDFTLVEAREILLELALQRGDIATARTLLAQSIALSPYATWPHRQMAALAAGEEQYAAAVSHLERALEIAPEEDALILALGEVLDLSGSSVQAVELYERALEINPKAEEIRRHVEFLKAEETPFEDAFKVDGASLAALHPPRPNKENNSHEYLLRHDVIKVNRDGTSSRYHHETVRILNDQGGNAFDQYVFSYSMGEQKARIKTARVIHPDGSVEEALIDNREHIGYERGGFLPAFVDLPPLHPGDIVDLEYRIDDTRQSIFGDYFGLRHFFQDSDLQEVRDSRLVLILPPDRSYRFNSRFIGDEARQETAGRDGSSIITWRIANIPKRDREPRMPGRIEFCPCLEVSTYSDWRELGEWWRNLLERQCDIDNAMKEKVGELIRGCRTEREKVRAIYNFVVSNIRYSDAWEFGIHGFKPYRATAIFANRFGDCKDKTILIKSLLGEAGITAHPVMIRSARFRSLEDLSLPLINHFNHAIAWVPSIDGGPGIFLDGTAQFHSMHAVPDGDQGATVVVVNDSDFEIRTIPFALPESNMEQRAFDVSLNDDGSATIEVHAEAKGTREAAMRQLYLNPGRRPEIFKSSYGGALGEVRVSDIRFSDLADLNVPAAYSVRVDAGDIVLRGGGTVQLRAILFRSGIGRLGAQDRRKTDMLMGAPSRAIDTITYRLPNAFRVEQLPEDRVLENEHASFRLTFSEPPGDAGKGGTIVVTRELDLRSPRIPLKDYPLFRDFCRQADKAERMMIQLSTEK